jgi:hypothetical protein
MSVPGSRKTHRAAKYEGYIDFKQLGLYAHIDISHNMYKLRAVATLEPLEPLPRKNYDRIVALRA